MIENRSIFLMFSCKLSIKFYKDKILIKNLKFFVFYTSKNYIDNEFKLTCCQISINFEVKQNFLQLQWKLFLEKPLYSNNFN